jgi:hypothetical protein
MAKSKGFAEKYHYAYRITFNPDKKHYMGIRTSFRPPLKDIGIHYFTSSTQSHFKNLFQKAPFLFKIKILKVCKTRKECLEFEVRYHKRLNVKSNPDFLNKSNQTTTFFDVSGTVVVSRKKYPLKWERIPTEEYHQNKNQFFIPSHFLRKDRNGHYGKKHTKETKEKLSLMNSNQVVAKTEDGSIVRIPKEEFLKRKDLHGVAKNTITAFDTIQGKYVRISKEDFYQNKARYYGVTKGKPAEKFKEKVYAFDKYEKKWCYVDKNIFYTYRDRFEHKTENRVNCIDIRTGESKCVPKEEFYKNEYLVGIRKKVKCPRCGEVGIGKKFRELHFKNCKKDMCNEN